MSDFEDDELITIKLPRKEYEVLKKMIAREEVMDWFTATAKSWWFFAVAGGVLTVWALADKIKGLF